MRRSGFWGTGVDMGRNAVLDHESEGWRIGHIPPGVQPRNWHGELIHDVNQLIQYSSRFSPYRSALTDP